jgi:hypothetical protein
MSFEGFIDTVLRLDLYQYVSSFAGRAFRLIVIDCSELSAEEKLALAMQVSDTLDGIAIALVKGEDMVMDKVSQEKPERLVVKEAVEDFISRRKDAANYFIEEVGERIVVHSADPASAMRKKAQNQLPPNLRQCPYCAFITPYEEECDVHVRAHLFGV